MAGKKEGFNGDHITLLRISTKWWYGVIPRVPGDQICGGLCHRVSLQDY